METKEKYVKEKILFTDYLRENKLYKKDFKTIITGINKCKKQESIDFNNIYYDGEKIKFKYQKEPQNFYYELSKLMIRLLRYVNVDSREDIGTAYSLFVTSSRDDYKVRDLLEIVER